MRSPWLGEDESSSGSAKQEEAWPALGDRAVAAMLEQLFSHLLKIINICAHVVDEVAPGPAVKVSRSFCLILTSRGPSLGTETALNWTGAFDRT